MSISQVGSEGREGNDKLGVFVVFLLLLWPQATWPAADASHGGSRVTTRQPGALEQTHGAISRKVTVFFDGIDNFFGNKRIDEESTGSRVRLNVLGTVDDGDIAYDANIQVKIRLPQVDKRLHLLLKGDSADDPLEETTDEDNPVLTEDDTVDSVALRYYHKETREWNVHTTGGLKFHLPLDPFVQARARRSFFLSQWGVRAAATLFWFKSSGFGQTARFDFERAISDDLFFRATTEAKWLNNDNRLTLNQNFSFYQTLNKRNALEWQAKIIGQNKPVKQVSSYYLGVSFRRKIHKQWLFLEVTPSALFPKDDNYQFSPSITLKLEIIFGDT